MSEPAPLIVKPEFMLIEEILDEIHSGRLRVPRFQRPYVWKPENMLRLFGSISRGYPIGTLLLWDASERLLSSEHIGPLPVPEAPKLPVTYILDGHQRLSTLYAVLRLGADFPRDEEQKHWQWWIYYDLETYRFLHLRSRPQEPHMMPLRALLRTTDFLKEARRIEAALPEARAAALIDRAESLAQKVKSCKLAIVRIQGGRLDDALDIFTRLNTTGQKMTQDQMLSALTYREGEDEFHLATRIDEILERLDEYHFGGIHRSTVYRAIIAAAGLDVHKTPGEEFIRDLRHQAPALVDTAESSIVRAAEILRGSLGVPGDKLLPYSHQLLLLSEFCRECPDPDNAQLETLRRWFWATSFSGWFAGASSTQIRMALEEMRSLATGSLQRLEVTPLDARARPFPNTFDMRSARLRAMLLVCVQRLRPRDADGDSLDVGRLIRSHGNRAFLHIFRRGAREVIASPANRILMPSVPGKTVREMLIALPDKVRASVLASHGIEDEAYGAIVKDEPAAFVAARARSLARLERDFMSELGVALPSEDFGDADIDTDDDL